MRSRTLAALAGVAVISLSPAALASEEPPASSTNQFDAGISLSLGADRPDNGFFFGPQGTWQMAGPNLFYSAGNVGIGTGAPGARLQVNGAATHTILSVNTRVGGNAVTGLGGVDGFTRGVFGLSSSNQGTGVFGQNNAPIGVTFGVDGQSSSTSGRGVRGRAISATGLTFGVYGQSDSDDGRGVFGYAPTAGGRTFGVFGLVDSDLGYGVFGQNLDPTGWSGAFAGMRGVRIQGIPLNIDDGDLNTASDASLLIEGRDAALEILADNQTNLGASILLKEVQTNGTYNDSWAIFRQASGTEDSSFGIGYTTNPGALAPLADFFVIETNGDIGMGREPLLNELELEGDASKTVAGNWAANSDARIKTEIKTVTDALDTLDQVRLVSFEYTDDYKAAHPKIADRRYLNVIAQEFAQVFPEHVRESGETLEDGSQILQVDTYPLTIYSAAGVQELHTIVKEQESRIAELEAKVESMSERRGLTQSSLVWPLAAAGLIGVLAVARRRAAPAS